MFSLKSESVATLRQTNRGHRLIEAPHRSPSITMADARQPPAQSPEGANAKENQHENNDNDGNSNGNADVEAQQRGEHAHRRPPLLPIYLSVFVDMLGIGLAIPVLPYYAVTFGASAFELGIVLSAFSAAQVLGSLLMGSMSDRYGRKRLLLVSLFGSTVSFAVVALAGDV